MREFKQFRKLPKWLISSTTSVPNQEPTASAIIATPIVLDDSRDILCWKPTPSGKCNSKSTYKLCLQQIHNLQANQPRQVNQSTKDILQQVWKHKFMAPRVKTFAWRFLRHALPTGLRAGRFSSHISSTCSRCDSDKDEMHLFFLCNFARASWFGHLGILDLIFLLSIIIPFLILFRF